MAQTFEVDGSCPVCGGEMLVTRLTCTQCGSALEGSFRLRGMASAATSSISSMSSISSASPLPGRRTPSGPLGARTASRSEDETRFGRLAYLDAAQLDFAQAFLRCRGVIKNVEDMLGISYPTVKARLAEVLNAMGFGPEEELPDGDRRRERREILADLAAGRITTEEAHRLLARGQAIAGNDAE